MFKMMPLFSASLQPSVKSSSILTLAFIAAFSLESNSAIILGAIAIAVTMNVALARRSDWGKNLLFLLTATSAFCAAALVITIVFANRPKATQKRSALTLLWDFVRHNESVDAHAKMYSLFLLLAVLLALSIAVLIYLARGQRFQMASQRGISEFSRKIWTANSPQLKWATFVLITAIPTMIVAGIVSLETKRDYFTPRVYPWGGFLLIVALFSIVAIVAIMEKLLRGNFLADSLRQLILAIIVSSAAVHCLSRIPSYNSDSERVLAGYRAAQNRSAGIFDTGLDLKHVVMGVRPLPTEGSPPWFFSYYRSFFKKYYGKDTDLSFK
jgi:hypothetical protein